jgi:hypothetical protein
MGDIEAARGARGRATRRTQGQEEQMASRRPDPPCCIAAGCITFLGLGCPGGGQVDTATKALAVGS